MIADEEDGVECSIQSLHHVEGLVLSRQVLGLPVKLVRWQVLHSAVGIVDQDIGGPSLNRPVDRRIDLRQQ